jgi:V/A-type H+-transporting ATPase subunit D
MDIADITPTRSELIELKKRVKIAEKGHQLLEMKRDGLIHEFFELLERAKGIRAEVTEAYAKAEDRFLLTKAVEGTQVMRAAAISGRDIPSVHLETKSVMGVYLPKIETDMDLKKKLSERGYGIIGTSALLDETVDAYEDLVEKIVEVAETETGLKRLIDDIESTKRRVNALQYKVIPDIKAATKYISMRLQELERENIFRLKRIKASG